LNPETIMPYSPEFIEEMRVALALSRRNLAFRQKRTHDEILNVKASDDGVHDSLDTSMLEQETGSLVNLKSRELKMLHEVDAALQRIIDGEYGFCVDSGDEIGEKRLRANPAARFGVEAQESHEEDARRRNFRPGMFDDM